MRHAGEASQVDLPRGCRLAYLVSVFDENRREARFPARIVARVVRRHETVELTTGDVSFRGAFLRTDAPPEIRQLIRVEFVMPTGDLVSAHAMVVHVVSPSADLFADTRGPGMGLQFWGPVEQSKAWEQYVYGLKAQQRPEPGIPAAHGSAPARSVPSIPTPAVVDRVRRSSERFKLRLEVVADDESLSTRDISEHGMAIRSNVGMPVGSRVHLTVRASGFEAIEIDVIVRREIDELSFRGVGVEFVDMNEDTRRALMAILRPASKEEDAVFVDRRDPALH